MRCYIGADIAGCIQTLDDGGNLIRKFLNARELYSISSLVIRIEYNDQLVIEKDTIYGVYAYRIGAPSYQHARVDQLFKKLCPKHVTMLRMGILPKFIKEVYCT
jgi:hypothetical protein